MSKVRTQSRFSFRVRMKRSAQPFPSGARTKAGELSMPTKASSFWKASDNLQVRDWPWRPEDRRMAQLASLYWVNFAKTVDPNGPGLPHWPAYSGSRDRKVMRFTAEPSSGVDPALSRYEVLDASYRPTPQ